MTSLMEVEQQPLLALQKKEPSYLSRISSLGNLKSALSTLQTAAANLIPDSTVSASEKFTSLKASTADNTIATATTSTGALASTYTLKNISLATAEQIRKTEGTLSVPATGTGTLSIKVGTGTAVDVSVTGGSSLSDIAKAINDARDTFQTNLFKDTCLKILTYDVSMIQRDTTPWDIPGGVQSIFCSVENIPADYKVEVKYKYVPLP